MPPMQGPLNSHPFSHQQMNPQPQQRFYHNNQNQFIQRQKQTMNHNNGPLVVNPNTNPFIPLQASRKATKLKSVQGESKKCAKEQNKPQQQAASQMPVVEAVSTSQETSALNSGSNPVVDMRKNRLAIDFSALN